MWASCSVSVPGSLYGRRPTAASLERSAIRPAPWSPARVTLVNTALKSEYKAISNDRGFYTFPTLPVGHYDLTIEATGFRTQTKANLAVDTDSALRVDLVLALGQQSETITVEATGGAVEAQVDTRRNTSRRSGDGSADDSAAVERPQLYRSAADSAGSHPGIHLEAEFRDHGGSHGTISPSGDLNPGDLSIDGQRESSNGFMVDGTDVQEHMNGGTSVVPNLDSIDEFRVLTNNFDPEYGNYNGGMINVITKSGSDAFHGNVFEFLRNTALDAENYFAPTAAFSGRISSAARSAARSSIRRFISSPTIRARGQRKA